MTIDPLKFVDLPENLQERDKYYLYSEMILQLQMARDHLLRQQSEKSVSSLECLMFFGQRGIFDFRMISQLAANVQDNLTQIVGSSMYFVFKFH